MYQARKGIGLVFVCYGNRFGFFNNDTATCGNHDIRDFAQILKRLYFTLTKPAFTFYVKNIIGFTTSQRRILSAGSRYGG
jgi:hypothetical protein